LSHLWPTGSQFGQPRFTTAWYFSSSPSDSASRQTPCPPTKKKTHTHIFFSFTDPRGITPEFGYEPPSPRLSGTLTRLMIVLPRTHYGVIRLPAVYLTSSSSTCPPYSLGGRQGLPSSHGVTMCSMPRPTIPGRQT